MVFTSPAKVLRVSSVHQKPPELEAKADCLHEEEEEEDKEDKEEEEEEKEEMVGMLSMLGSASGPDWSSADLEDDISIDQQ